MSIESMAKSFLAGFCWGAASTKVRHGEVKEAAVLTAAGIVIWDSKKHPDTQSTLLTHMPNGEEREE